MTLLKILSVIGSFFGVYLSTLNRNGSEDEYNLYYIGIICTAIACVLIAGVSIMQRMLNKHIHYILSPFYFGILTIYEALLLSLVLEN
mmetsp:Transcript_20824/g.18448  ORF Transcript_20824/g.18448 Transcript_20824/m.18448 type:complete len:88 (-) Transcript_20824:483-746(-)